jgi:transposase-like protein
MKVNKSELIRQLHDQGYSISDIAHKLGIRYQYAYNVVSYYIKQKELMAAHHQAATTEAPSQPKFSLWRWITGR